MGAAPSSTSTRLASCRQASGRSSGATSTGEVAPVVASRCRHTVMGLSSSGRGDAITHSLTMARSRWGYSSSRAPNHEITRRKLVRRATSEDGAGSRVKSASSPSPSKDIAASTRPRPRSNPPSRGWPENATGPSGRSARRAGTAWSTSPSAPGWMTSRAGRPSGRLGRVTGSRCEPEEARASRQPEAHDCPLERRVRRRSDGEAERLPTSENMAVACCRRQAR